MSQYGEHVKILEYFAGHVGRFLDIGAGSADCKSNTVPLVEAGWSGVMVEPAISQLRWLIEKYGDHPRVEILPVAVGWQVRTLFDGGDYSTLLTDHCKLITQHSQGSVKFRVRPAVCVDADELMAIAPGPYDFLNVDVEGLNLQVISWLRFSGLNIRMACVEMDPPGEVDLIRNCLRGQGLINQQEFGGNLLAWR